MATFNLKNVNASVNGIPVTGLAPGDDAIVLAYNEDFNEVQVGSTGETAFIEHNDRSAQITFRLMQSSNMNDAFSAILAANAEFALAVVDQNGTSVAASPSCKIMKAPDQSFGDALNEREWIVIAAELISNVGGFQ